MKNQLPQYFLLLSLFSCASQNEEWSPSVRVKDWNLQVEFFKYKGFEMVNLEPSCKFFEDPLDQKNVSQCESIDSEKKYYEWQQEGRITRNVNHSCLESDKSVNYINILSDSIPYLRQYSRESFFVAEFNNTDSLSNNQYRTLSSEKRVSSYRVKSNECYKEINGITHKVISEIYSE